jgi:hypothetical protein
MKPLYMYMYIQYFFLFLFQLISIFKPIDDFTGFLFSPIDTVVVVIW